MEIIISPDARDDLDGIFEFIAKDNIFYAELVISKITDAMRTFYVAPRMWKQVKENPEIREYIWPYKYFIRYEISEDTLVITAIYKKVYRMIN